MTYDKEFLISELQRFVSENNNNLKLNDIQGKLDYPSFILYDIYFDSFDIAINIIESNLNNELIEKKYLIFELQRFVLENGRNPEIIELYKIFGCCGFINFLKYFDCISDVLIDIELKIDIDYTRKRCLLLQLRIFADIYKKNPCKNDINNNPYFIKHNITSYSYTNNFGSLHNALIYAGLKIDLEYQKILDEQFLISELQRFVSENNRNPRQIDMFKKNGYPSMNRYLKYFGSWNNALMEAGLEIEKKLTDKEFLISELRRFVLENGRNPTIFDMTSKNGYPYSFAYIKQFGSWSNALITSKIKMNKNLIDKEFLISELQRFKLENGRNPRSSDMQIKNSYPNYNIYQKYFGSWFNAIVEAEINERQKLK